MPQLILTTKKGRDLCYAFQNESTLRDTINQIREALEDEESQGVDVTYTDLMGKMRTLIISRKFLEKVTISTL